MNDASMTWPDEDFLDDTLTVDRGRSVGTLCFVFSEVAGGVNSDGIGYTDIFPEVDRARMLCFSGVEEACVVDGEIERETRRTSESSGIESTILPSVDAPVGTSQTYTNLSESAIDRKRFDGSCDASHWRHLINDACPVNEANDFALRASKALESKWPGVVERRWIP